MAGQRPGEQEGLASQDGPAGASPPGEAGAERAWSRP